MTFLLSCALAAATAAPAADPPASQSIDLEFRIIQYEPEVAVEAPILNDIPVLRLFYSRKDGAKEPMPEVFYDRKNGAERIEAAQSPNNDASDQRAVALVADEILLRIADQAMRLSGSADNAQSDDNNDTPRNWTVLSAPRISVLPGQPAAVSVGREVPYMEMSDDGCLRVATDAKASEGIWLDVTADAAADQTVLIRSLNLRVSQVTGRTPIPNVPFDVGAPLISTREMNTSFNIAADKVALLRFPRAKPGDPEVMLAVKGRLVDAK